MLRFLPRAKVCFERSLEVDVSLLWSNLSESVPRRPCPSSAAILTPVQSIPLSGAAGKTLTHFTHSHSAAKFKYLKFKYFSQQLSFSRTDSHTHTHTHTDSHTRFHADTPASYQTHSRVSVPLPPRPSHNKSPNAICHLNRGDG